MYKHSTSTGGELSLGWRVPTIAVFFPSWVRSGSERVWSTVQQGILVAEGGEVWGSACCPEGGEDVSHVAATCHKVQHHMRRRHLCFRLT